MVSQVTEFSAHIGIDWANKNMTIVFKAGGYQVEGDVSVIMFPAQKPQMKGLH